ncbi:hypothetical protein [Nocardiopsis alba]|uniref:hypothetical protein n=1 Tax=Nocardiopsis alba TaxID=53437 RepID=UPI00363BA003
MRTAATLTLSLALLTACAAPPATDSTSTPEQITDTPPSGPTQGAESPSPEEERSETIAELEQQWPGAEDFIAHADANDWDYRTNRTHRGTDFWFGDDLLAIGYGLWSVDRINTAVEEGYSEHDWRDVLFETGVVSMIETSSEPLAPELVDLAVQTFAPELEEPLQQQIDAYHRGFSSGTHIVGQDIEAGTYTATARDGELFENAYWERTSTSGDIIANDFVGSAQSVTVTIASSDGQFTARGLGFWTRVD